MRYSELLVQHGFVQAGDVQLHYAEAGNGPLVLLLHGFPETWWCWRYQMPALAQAGFRVVAPDLRGYGASAKQGPFDLATLSQDIQNLIHALDEEQAYVIGHDWGGAIAWHFAAHHSESCRGLAVLNCPHPKVFARALRSSPRQLARSWYMLAFQLPWLPELALQGARGALLRRMYALNVPRRVRENPEEIEPFVEAMQSPKAASSALAYYRTAIRQLAATGGKEARLPRIETPTLLLWGKKDKFLDYDSVVPGTERYVSNLRVQTLADCGHFIQQERPEQVNPLLIDFLKS